MRVSKKISKRGPKSLCRAGLARQPLGRPSENSRALSENFRRPSENSRALSENSRRPAENSRALFENSRRLSENSRALSETFRRLSENFRALSENSRRPSENFRRASEMFRKRLTGRAAGCKWLRNRVIFKVKNGVCGVANDGSPGGSGGEFGRISGKPG